MLLRCSQVDAISGGSSRDGRTRVERGRTAPCCKDSRYGYNILLRTRLQHRLPRSTRRHQQVPVRVARGVNR